MKLSKTFWIFLVIGIFVISAAGLGMAYLRQTAQQSRLEEELASAQLRLEELPDEQFASQQKGLESRLARAELQLITTKANLYQSTESIEASDALVELAKGFYVEITEISSPGIMTEQIGEVTLSALQITVTVEGNVFDLIAYISEWTEEYPTGIVEPVEISVPEPTDEEVEEEETEEENPSAIINLHIYTYEGD